jgi:amino acid permease
MIRFCWIVLIAAELVAITHIFQFEYPEDLLREAGYPATTLRSWPDVSPSVIVFLFLILMGLINLLPVRHFGQIEYIFGSLKIIFIVILIVLNVVLHIVQPVYHGPFWTYNDPYSFTARNITLPNGHVVTGGPGQLGGMWEAMTTCLFGMIGFETVAITAAENRDLRTEETMKIATRKISLRIITLYTLATFAVGLNVPYTYPLIQDNSVISFGYGQNSVFVIATVLNRLTSWPYFINDFIVFTAFSAGANGLYNASRTLHALASIPDAWPDWEPIQALRRRLERTRYGVPHAAALVSWLFGLLGFLADNPSSQVVSFLIGYFLVRWLIVELDSRANGPFCRCFHANHLRYDSGLISGILPKVAIRYLPATDWH